jgi:hypothetical protein
LLHLVGDLFELYDDARTYKLCILNFLVFGIAGNWEKYSTSKKGNNKGEEKVAYRNKERAPQSVT